MSIHRASIVVAALAATAIAAGMLLHPRHTLAQTPSSLSSEDLLSLVLPPGPGGSRPPVHMWARADQAQGPGGYPTVFVVTLFTEQGASGPEEHEVVNYVQYSSGGWAPARPQGDGTLLLNDWAWISLNLTNLSATASGSGSNSTYTVDYAASGPYGSSTRQLALEEVYGADLSLLSSTVLSDTNPSTGSAATPASAPATAPASAATATPPAAATATPAGGSNAPAPLAPAATSLPSSSGSNAPPSQPAPAGGNTIRPGTLTPTPAH
jgi:hypothetical protein